MTNRIELLGEGDGNFKLKLEEAAQHCAPGDYMAIVEHDGYCNLLNHKGSCNCDPRVEIKPIYET